MVVVLSVGLSASILAAILAQSPHKLIAYDPHATLFHVQWVQENGSILRDWAGTRGGVRGLIYPAFYSLVSIWVAVVNLEPEFATAILPLFLIPLLPLLVFLVSRFRWGIVSLIGVIPTFYIFFAVLPTAQMFAMPLVILLFFITRNIYRNHNQRRFGLLFVIILFTLALTHSYTAVVAVLALFGLALSPGRKLTTALITPILSGVVVVAVWTIQEKPFMLNQVTDLIILLATDFETETVPSPPGFSSTHPAQIEILFFSRFFPDWIAFSTRVAFFILLGIIFLFTGGIAVAKLDADVWDDEIRLFGFGAAGSLAFSFAVPSVNFNRFWALAMLFTPPAIVTLRQRLTFAAKHVFAACLIIFVISQSLYLAPAVFSDEINSESYTGVGRPVYHSDSQYATAEFTNQYELEPIASDRRMYFIEPRYQRDVELKGSCYVESCSVPTVVWMDTYSEMWISGGLYGEFPDGEKRLKSDRNAIYSNNAISLYRY
ncbi:hypothetical protein [Natrarchaeobius chitinivorans]|uniref:hypothetical protein n=1 Tax=Natrarchaeobius chitinivorans TaxID=1679083 RepID=UPI000F545FA5|nr:hypothetical protein [Natrarchaeobius chitinivorans]